MTTSDDRPADAGTNRGTETPPAWWRSRTAIGLACFVAGLAIGGGALGLLLPGRKAEPPPAPVVARVENRQAERPVRTVQTAELIAWATEPAPFAIVENAVDALPNGLSMKSIPFVVNWKESSAPDDPRGEYILHHVNVGGNPVKGTTVLATVAVPAGAIERVEFVMVRDRKNRELTAMGHGQLRFVFSADRRPRIISPMQTQFMGDLQLDDLIFSYEAWRGPGVPYEGLKGLDPEAYSLTVRCIAGPHSFLHAAIKDAAWEAYPLRLPDAPDAGDELLRMCLLIGDGISRQVIHRMLTAGELDEPTEELLAEWSPEDLERARALFSLDNMPADPLQDLIGESDLGYHLLEQSCVTMALFTIDLAFERVSERIGDESRRRIRLGPKTIPSWVDRIPEAGRGEMLTLVPGALLWVARNQEVLPANAYRLLEGAGALRQEDGATVRYLYTPEGMTPYGSLAENM